MSSCCLDFNLGIDSSRNSMTDSYSAFGPFSVIRCHRFSPVLPKSNSLAPSSSSSSSYPAVSWLYMLLCMIWVTVPSYASSFYLTSSIFACTMSNASTLSLCEATFYSKCSLTILCADSRTSPRYMSSEILPLNLSVMISMMHPMKCSGIIS